MHHHSYHFDHVIAILTCQSLINSEMTKRKTGTIDAASDFCICCYCVEQCSSVCVIYVQFFKKLHTYSTSLKQETSDFAFEN